ncbi:osiris 3 [Haematobia irritans]|uniref:osiris 3 n=1 Tax=Haematobia irritans TaxID=7368 RepID=UPI003F4F5894
MRTTLILWTIVCTAVLSAYATPAISSNENAIPAVNRNQLEEGFLRKLNTKCSQRDNHSCMMLKLIVYMNRIFKKSSLEVNKKVTVTQNRDIDEIPDDPEDDMLLARSIDSDDETLALLVASKVRKFISSRTLRYHFSDNADFVAYSEPAGNLNFGVSISPVSAFEEGRGKMKNMMPIIMMMAGKAGIVGAIILKGLFLLAGKALIVSKIALLLSVIIALKKLLSQKKHVVEVPHHDSYSSGWARALDGFMEGLVEVPAKILADEAHDMAFSGQKPVAS